MDVPKNLLQYGDAISKISKLNATGTLTIKNFTTAMQGLSQTQIANLAIKNKDLLFSQAKNKEDLITLLTKHGMAEAQATETAAIIFNTGIKEANTKATLGQTVSNLGLLGSIKAITTGLLAQASAWAMTPMGMITIAVSSIFVLTTAFNNYKKSIQESVDKVKELADNHKQSQTTMSDNVSSLENLRNAYDELSKGVDSQGNNVSLSTEKYAEYNSIVQQIIDKVPDLVDGYNSEGKAIIQRNNLIDKAITKQKEYYDVATATYLNTGSSIVEGINAANKQLEEALGYSGFWNGTSIGEDIANQLYGGFLGRWGELIKSGYSFIFGNTTGQNFGLNVSKLEKGDIDQLNLVRENMQALIEAFDMSEVEVEKFRETVQNIGIEMSSNSQMVSEYARYLTTWAFASKEQGGAIASGFEEFSKISDEYIEAFTTGIQNIANTSTPDLATQKKELLKLAQLYLKVQDVIPEGQVAELNKRFAEGTIIVEDYESQIKEIQKKLELIGINDTDFFINQVFHIEKIDNMQKLIDEALGLSKEEIEQGIHLPITIELSKILNIEELANMQRYISEAKDEAEAMIRAESISKIFDDKALINGVRSIQAELDNGKISYSEYQTKLSDLYNKLEDPNAIETFIELFNRTAPSITSATNTIVTEFNRISDVFDKLQSAMGKAKSGEAFSMKEIMELVESGYVKLSDVNFTNMTIPVEAFKQGLGEIDNEWKIFIKNKRTSLSEGFKEAAEERRKVVLKEWQELNSKTDRTTEEDTRFKQLAQEWFDLKTVIDNEDIELAIKISEDSQVNADNFIITVKGIKTEIEGVNNTPLEIKSIQNIDFIQSMSNTVDKINLFKQAQKEMSDAGGISFETFKKLSESASDILQYISVVNGNLQLNTDAWNKNYGAAASAKKALQDYTATLPSHNERIKEQIEFQKYLYDEYVRLRDGIETNAEAIARLNIEIDNIQSSYSTLATAMDEYNENGKFSLDTFQALLSLSPEYLSYLDLENGKLIINTQKVNELIEAMKQEAIIKLQNAAVSDIKALAEKRDADMSTLAKEAIDNLGDSAETTGQQMANATDDVFAFGIAVQTTLAGMGVDTSEVTDQVNAIISVYQNAANTISGFKIDFSKSNITSSKKDSSKSEYSKTFDWIERKLKHLSSITDDWKSKLNSAISLKEKNSSIDGIIQSLQDEADTYDEAYKHYMKKANSVGLGDEYKNKVISGDYSIEELKGSTDEVTAKKIEAFKEWYENAEAVRKSLIGIGKEIRDYEWQKIDNIAADYDNRVKRISSIRDDWKAKLESAVSLKDKNKSINGIINTLNSEKTIYEEAAAYYMKQADSLDLDKKYRDKIISGNYSIEELKAGASKELAEMIDTFAKLYDLAGEAKRSIAGKNIEIKDNSWQKIDNIAADYDGKIKQRNEEINRLKAEISLSEAKGESPDVGKYVSIKSYEKENRELYQSKYDGIKAEFENLKKLGELTSDDWVKYTGLLADTRTELINCDITIQGIDDSIRSIKWKSFNVVIGKINNLSFVLFNMMSQFTRSSYNEFGNLTYIGLTYKVLI